jgi:hypothetical protein
MRKRLPSSSPTPCRGRLDLPESTTCLLAASCPPLFATAGAWVRGAVGCGFGWSQGSRHEGCFPPFSSGGGSRFSLPPACPRVRCCRWCWKNHAGGEWIKVWAQEIPEGGGRGGESEEGRPCPQ